MLTRSLHKPSWLGSFIGRASSVCSLIELAHFPSCVLLQVNMPFLRRLTFCVNHFCHFGEWPCCKSWNHYCLFNCAFKKCVDQQFHATWWILLVLGYFSSDSSRIFALLPFALVKIRLLLDLEAPWIFFSTSPPSVGEWRRYASTVGLYSSIEEISQHLGHPYSNEDLHWRFTPFWANQIYFTLVNFVIFAMG